MKELFLVGISAGIGGIALGKWGGPIEVKLNSISASIPPAAVHFVLVGSAAVGVYALARKIA